MIYRAALFRWKLFGTLVAALIAATVAIFVATSNMLMASLFSVMAILGYFRLQYRYLAFEGDSMIYVAWLTRHLVRRSELKGVRAASECAWPSNRLHGPADYKVETTRGSFWLGMVWFDADASRAFHEFVAPSYEAPGKERDRPK